MRRALWMCCVVWVMCGCEKAPSGEGGGGAESAADAGPAAAGTASDAASSVSPKPPTRRPPASGDGSCMPMGNMQPVSEGAEAKLEVTVDGKPVVLKLASPGQVFEAGGVVPQKTPGLCTGLTRTLKPARGGRADWMEMATQVVFVDEAGEPSAWLLVAGGGLGWKRPIFAVSVGGEVYEGSRFTEGESKLGPDPVLCGGPATLTWTGLKGEIGKKSAPRERVPITLDGTLTLPMPDGKAGPESTETVAPLTGCESDPTRAMKVTSSDPARLPFAGSCWSSGDLMAGGGVYAVGLRARPESQPAASLMMKTIPWNMTLHLDLSAAEPGMKLPVVMPDERAIMQQMRPSKGNAFATIQRGTDGLGGVDFIATGGTVTVDAITLTDKPGSMFQAIDATGTFELQFQDLGPCSTQPSPQGDPITVTGEFVLKN